MLGGSCGSSSLFSPPLVLPFTDNLVLPWPKAALLMFIQAYVLCFWGPLMEGEVGQDTEPTQE